MDFDHILATVEDAGFLYLGGFHPEPQQTLMLIGNAGPQMWQKFNASCDSGTLDQWSKTTITRLAKTIGATALFPFDTPPHPFLTWAEKSGETFTSPIGLSIHPRYGLWHGYRAALIFECNLNLPPVTASKSPCDSCAEKPCLTICPVNAFTPQGYNVPKCIDHIKTSGETDCLELGCRARRACPIGRDFHYAPQQARFHMSAFVKAQG